MFKRSDERKLCRLHGYDYSQNGYYFVTICVFDMDHVFGHIFDGEMQLNIFGKITKQCLFDLPNHYSNCFIDEMIIMPNHVHGIIVIDNDITVKRHGLSEMIRAFKTFSARKINKEYPNIGFKWHKSFNDRIIRNEKELYAIRQYIKNNPTNS